jgi:ABC-type uncharacterized transport system ATPase subunit
MVHQHFMLVPVFTVAENVVLGVEPTKAVAGVKLDLGHGARQQVRSRSPTQYGIAPRSGRQDRGSAGRSSNSASRSSRCCSATASIVIFDEPTAVLTPQEVERLLQVIVELAEAPPARAIVFITHKLREAILEVADRIEVLRRGKTVGDADPKTVKDTELAEMMVGRPVDLVVDKQLHERGDVVLDVRDFTVRDPGGRPLVDHVAFQVHAGEIVGIAGVQGNGQTELVEALVGLRRVADGSVHLQGQDITVADPRDMHRHGVAHIPEDRQREGIVKDFDITENLALTAYYAPPLSKGVVIDWGSARHEAERLVEQFDIRTPSVDTAVGTLSGGNQQKVIVARELSRDLKLAIACQPTRGIDVGSIEYIHERIVALRDAGVAVLVVSTELDEVMALADRVLVMYRGRVVADLPRSSTDHNEVGLYMAGAKESAA